MIDTKSEALLTLAEASELVRKHVATVYRWTHTGFRGVILESLQMGGTRYTSHEALQRFCELVTNTDPRRRPEAVRARIEAQKIAQELRRYGV